MVTCEAGLGLPEACGTDFYAADLQTVSNEAARAELLDVHGPDGKVDAADSQPALADAARAELLDVDGLTEETTVGAFELLGSPMPLAQGDVPAEPAPDIPNSKNSQMDIVRIFVRSLMSVECGLFCTYFGPLPWL